MELIQEQKDAIFKMLLDLSIWRGRQKAADAAVSQADEARGTLMADLHDLEELFPQEGGGPTWVEAAHTVIQDSL